MPISRFSRVLSKAEKAKKWAGQNAIKHVLERRPTIIGLGSGSTIVYAIEHLATTSLAKSAICIPTSFQTRELILSHKLCLGSIEQHPNIDITIDGADEIDPDLNAIKGGGACLFQERLIAQATKEFVLVADETKISKQLGQQWRRGVPVEVLPIALSSIQLTLERLFGNAHIKLRMATPSDKAGPVVTDNGNLILDCDFGPLDDSARLYKKIKCLSGVLDVGLFCNMATTAYIGRLEDGDGYNIVKKATS